MGVVDDLAADVDRGRRSGRGPARRSRWPARPRRRTSAGRPARPGGSPPPPPSARGAAAPAAASPRPAARRRPMPRVEVSATERTTARGWPRRGVGQPGRLHVGRQGAGGRQRGPLAGPVTRVGEETIGPVTTWRPARAQLGRHQLAPGQRPAPPCRRRRAARSPPPAGPGTSSGVEAAGHPDHGDRRALGRAVRASVGPARPGPRAGPCRSPRPGRRRPRASIRSADDHRELSHGPPPAGSGRGPRAGTPAGRGGS